MKDLRTLNELGQMVGNVEKQAHLMFLPTNRTASVAISATKVEGNAWSYSFQLGSEPDAVGFIQSPRRAVLVSAGDKILTATVRLSEESSPFSSWEAGDVFAPVLGFTAATQHHEGWIISAGGFVSERLDLLTALVLREILHGDICLREIVVWHESLAALEESLEAQVRFFGTMPIRKDEKEIQQGIVYAGDLFFDVGFPVFMVNRFDQDLRVGQRILWRFVSNTPEPTLDRIRRILGVGVQSPPLLTSTIWLHGQEDVQLGIEVRRPKGYTDHRPGPGE